jgi:ABC-type transport system involved in multi-copper enzyme maturation permease subunit
MELGSTPVLLGAMSTWLTPPWMYGVGAAIGLAVLAVGYLVVRLVSRPGTAFLHDSLREGFLFPVLVLAAVMAVIAAAATPVVPVRDLLRSLTHLPSAGKLDRTFTIPAKAQNEAVDLELRPSELKTLTIESDRDLAILLTEYGIIKEAKEARKDIIAGEPWRWKRLGGQEDIPIRPGEQSTKSQTTLEHEVAENSETSEDSLFYGDSATMTIKNLSDKPATVRFLGDTTEEYPQVAVIPQTAAALVGLVVGFLLLKLALPKVMAIALATLREVTLTPLFQVVMILGVFLVVVSVIIPQFTFGEDVKMMKMSVVPLIRNLAILVAIWTASESISAEIEGRTAMTVLAKPIGRRQFLIGKFIGVALPAALMFIFLGALMMLMISYKVVYDAREGAQLEPTWQASFAAMSSTVPGLVLAFFETVMLAAIAVALSTRLPMLANLIVCVSVFVLGHLTPILVASRVGDQYGIVRFVGNLLAAVIPVLDHFDNDPAVAEGLAVPLPYLGWALGYCLLYSTVAMLLALALFEDRDLA